MAKSKKEDDDFARYASLQIRFATDTLRYRYASLQTDWATCWWGVEMMGGACLNGGGTFEEMLMRNEFRQLWRKYPKVEGHAVKDDLLYVLEFGGVWDNGRLIVCDKETGREHTHLQKLLHEYEVEGELKKIYGEVV